MSGLSISFDTRALRDQVQALREDLAHAERAAAQAGAQVLYDEVKQNVGRLGRHTGNLERAIYQAYSKDQSIDNQQVYHISWNARKAPHGHLVEFGYRQLYQVVKDRKTGKWISLKNRRLASPKQVPPQAFVRRAWAKYPLALQAIEKELFLRLKEFK